MAETQPTPAPAPAAPSPSGPADRPPRRTARLVKEIRTFAEAHGGAGAQIAYLGRKGARIVLVGDDGRWGDLVAPSMTVAEDAVRRSGVTVHESFDGEFAAKVRTGSYEWSRMAGIQLGGPRNT